MNTKVKRIAQVNHLVSIMLVCAGGGAGVADLTGHLFVWWGALVGSLLGLGLALLTVLQNRQ